MFEAALRQLEQLNPPPGVVLISGDIVDHGTEAEYAHAAALLGSVRQPLLIIPGNHDDREGFRARFRHHAHLAPAGPLR